VQQIADDDLALPVPPQRLVPIDLIAVGTAHPLLGDVPFRLQIANDPANGALGDANLLSDLAGGALPVLADRRQHSPMIADKSPDRTRTHKSSFGPHEINKSMWHKSHTHYSVFPLVCQLNGGSYQ